jgi:hypothetical protein
MSWNDGNTDNPRTVSPTTTTTFTATGTDSNGCTNTGATTITVNAQDSAAFSYAASTYCANGTDPTPTITGTSGGAFTSTTGLVINSGTGAIDLDASTVGAYSITYTTTGVCSANQSVNLTINAADNAAFSYSASSYAPTDSDPTPTITGLTGGTFSGTTGLVIDSSTGVIDLSASTVAAHTITYNTSSSGSSVCPNTSTQSVEIAASGIANNYSMNFDGVNDYIDAGNDSSLTPTNGISISFWIKTTDTTQNTGLIDKYNGSTGDGYAVDIKDTYLRFIIGIQDLHSTTSISDGIWHNVVFTCDNTNGYIYVDGSQVKTGSLTLSRISTSRNLYLMGDAIYPQSTLNTAGQMDEVAIWNTALTSTQVSEIYNATSTNLTKDLTTVSGSNLKYWNRMGD